MTLTRSFVNWTIRSIIRLICRVDDQQLSLVPGSGPLILAVNHINFLDVPLIYTHLQPRRLTALAKAETWDNPFLGFLGNLWEGIPIQRGEVDKNAFRLSLDYLSAGNILAVAPEGTRSGNGVLQKGFPGIVILALRSQAPILPLVHYGTESFWKNRKLFRRTQIHLAVGQPFTINDQGKPLTRDSRQLITDEIMYQMAALLPPEYRGEYADLTKATTTYLQFLPHTKMVRTRLAPAF